MPITGPVASLRTWKSRLTSTHWSRSWRRCRRLLAGSRWPLKRLVGRRPAQNLSKQPTDGALVAALGHADVGIAGEGAALVGRQGAEHRHGHVFHRHHGTKFLEKVGRVSVVELRF